MYPLEATVKEKETAHMAKQTPPTWDEWHQRFGHIGFSTLKEVFGKGVVRGFDVDAASVPSPTCKVCIQAKMLRKPFPKEAQTKPEKPGDLTHSDVWGPARIESLGKSNYYISFTDGATHHATIKFMKRKSDVPDRVKEYVTLFETQFGSTPKQFRVDNAKEYVEGDLKKWLDTKGITIEATAPHSPSQNGVSERANRTWIELARAMLIESGLPTYLWAEAVQHSVYLRNLVTIRSTKTPEEALTNTRPDVSHLRPFGCDVWIRREENGLSKLEPRAAKHVFVGFEDGPKAVRYFKRETRQVLVSRNFRFNENHQATDLEVGTSSNGPTLEGVSRIDESEEEGERKPSEAPEIEEGKHELHEAPEERPESEPTKEKQSTPPQRRLKARG